METKKTPRADIDRNRGIYLWMGFVVALSTLFVLLEWESSPPDLSDWQSLVPAFEESDWDDLLAPELLDEYLSKKDNPETEFREVTPGIVFEGYQIADEVPLLEELLLDSLLLMTKSIPKIPPNELETLKNNEAKEETIHTQADVMPQFSGGQIELVRFIYKHVQYPSAALKQRIQGRVWCSFIVNKDGAVSDLQIEKGIYSFLDDEAIRVLRLMPAWIPGKIDNEPVRVKVYVPIVFKY